MGGQLVQGGVLCAAACDVQFIPVLPGEGFQLPEGFPVAVRQRMVDAVDEVRIRGRGFAGLGKSRLDLRAHILRGREAGGVHIKNAGVGASLCQLHHLGKGDAQLLLHTLDDPQTHDVFQVADVPHAALVGKQLGTTCRNLPQVHTIVRMLRMVLECVCPAVILKGEVVMAPRELAAYFGTPEKPECHMLYNVSTMVNLWSALASRDTRLLKAQLDALHALPKNCWFVNYLRCHDDIGWGLDEAVENRLGMDPQKHKEYLYHFYEGNFPGSWAKGELYNYDPATGDARSCGTTASLCGVEQALEKDDKTALDYAVKRDLLLHTAMAFLQGFPMLNCGDEIAQLNGWDYKNDPDRVEDSRNLHRSKFNWEDAKQRTQKGTLQNALWQGMEQLRQMRADSCFAPDAWVTTWDSHNPGVLALIRKRGEETLVGLFNFTEYPAGASLDALGGEYHTPEGTSVWLADVELKPYQALLVRR